MKNARILICDDEPAIRKTLSEILQDEGCRVETADSGEALINLLRKSETRVDAIILDVWLPGMGGVEALAKIREMGHQTPVVVISGHATLDSAVQATKLGAFDFLEKPLNLDKVILTVANALKQARLERRQAQLEAQLPQTEIIGESPAIRELKDQIARAAPSRGRVLIFGESGSGKELAARLIHRMSDRADEPFVEMNCAAIPEELIESELFGHIKGSFTGALETRQGKFVQADGGALFLDEIADMSLNTQAKALRALQEQRFQPIGSAKTVRVDVRVIAATNKNLEKEIEAGRFREDLYYRLNVVPIIIPPLRERAEDIPLLCRHFSDEFAAAYGRRPIVFAEAAIDALMGYRWPGNVRELRNMVERLVIMSREDLIDLGDLPEQVCGKSSDDALFSGFGSLKEARDHFEKRYIEHSLRRHDGNITKTAEALKLERSNLHKKIKTYEIETANLGGS